MARISINGAQHYSTSTGEDVVTTIQTLTTLGQLLDVLLTGLADDEFLKYNSTSGKWENTDEIDGGTF